MNLPPIICDRQPRCHESWEKFLELCDLVETHVDGDAITYHFRIVNHNYFVLPNGYLHDNMGHYGEVFMERIRKEGWEEAMNAIASAKLFLESLARPSNKY